LKIKDLEARISKDEPRAKKAADQNKSLLSALENLRKDSAKIRQQLTKLGWEEGKDEDMKKRKSDLQNNIRKLTEQSDALKRKIANIDFSYSDPTPNFDRNKVKGLIAQLFSLPEQNFKSATALEICAGGRLYNVVVENEVVATQLLEKGKLRKRVTIIPLNKISTFTASAEKIGAAKKLAPGKVDLALSLVGYEDQVQKAMEYVFGSTFICADAETAKLVTFNPAVRMRCVTVEGDVYDPSGTLSGGSSPSSSGILIQIQKLNEITRQLEACKVEFATLVATMEREGKKTEEARKLKQQLDLKEHEIKLSEEQINSNSASRVCSSWG
jgi:structural maintenance of chromosome 2